ncbi:MAG TPA: DUF4097 family beta strand repeat-containing protein [Steroidobacteraceae bacterium]|nr:DUF4097 family beta strand repeat-containing protein [Steroidobacteraceae bacterium]
MRKAIPSLAALAMLVVAGAAGAHPCRYSAPRNLDLDATTLKSLLLNLGAADAHVQGVDGLAKIQVRGTACASNPRWLDDLRIDNTRSGAEATVTVRTGDHPNTFDLSGLSRYAYLKLTVSVPPRLAVAINSGSGDVIAQSLASLDFHSGSGDLKAEQISGALALQVGSGDVDAHGVGNVELRSTGSGDVTVSDVRGEVRAGHAGSADLHFRDVLGSVSLGSIGSGDLHLENIGGNIQVDSIGSGDLVVDNVTGNLQVDATGSGDVSYHGVKGSVHVPSSKD